MPRPRVEIRPALEAHNPRTCWELVCRNRRRHRPAGGRRLNSLPTASGLVFMGAYGARRAIPASGLSLADGAQLALCTLLTIIVTSGSMLINDYHDFMRGVDTIKTKPDRPLPRGDISPHMVKRALKWMYAAHLSLICLVDAAPTRLWVLGSTLLTYLYSQVGEVPPGPEPRCGRCARRHGVAGSTPRPTCRQVPGAPCHWRASTLLAVRRGAIIAPSLQYHYDTVTTPLRHRYVEAPITAPSRSRSITAPEAAHRPQEFRLRADHRHGGGPTAALLLALLPVLQL